MRLLLTSALLLLAITPASAQTLDSGTGLVASQAVATPPNTPPIDRPGAMRRAVARQHQARSKPPH